MAAGISAPEQVDVEALFAQLKEEVRKAGSGVDGEGRSRRLAARAQAERMWPVSAERPLERRPGLKGLALRPVKPLLRRLMRWYVEPLAYDQRSFNAAALRLIDDLQEQVTALRAQLDAERRR